MKTTFTLTLLAAFGLSSSASFAMDLTGAGSTFVYPILAKWADQYKGVSGHKVNYQSIGSGGGIKQIEAKPSTVDFGATDMPLKPEELKKEGLVQFPLINGGIVPIVNLKSVKTNELKLDGEVLAGIFMGTITKWNDPKIVKMNKEMKLPATEITVVHRADGSGTSFIWTNYLSKVNADWKAKVGEGSAVNWPVGLGGKGNEGVASFVKNTEGAIGYVEYAYAVQNKLTSTQVKNQTGNFVKPSIESFQAASSSAKWEKAENFYLVLTDAPGKASWPIAGTTFILMHQEQTKPEGAEAIKFFQWAYKNGAASAKELEYVPLPSNVVGLVEKTWKTIKQ